ncbi:tachykinins isoform X1 [Plutella xylostella]|uniref:tachykinins isoform X1 n=2 Tax=Plutella xylostella TaxID=51655 RepID=UPI002032601F|nr:tachykinins isoform X1 [Plutella xylostella]
MIQIGAAMGLTLKTCLLMLSLQLALSGAQEAAKRAPSGFLGMRGKKYYSAETEHFFKRKPQFFVGVKGKRTYQDLMAELYKRAPMGFVGMRGKKDDVADFNYPEYKRAPMGFVGMRGKKESDFGYNQQSYEYFPKQASLIGQIDYSVNEDLQREPAFPLLDHFLDNYLRQLKEEDTGGANVSNQDPSDSNQTREVTDPDSGSEEMPNDVDKRAARFHQFYGVRGKKSIQTKRPFDVSFRGKFIGVRGKKDLKNSDAKVKFLPDGPWAKRRAQMNGFFGMRGKKWTDDSSLEVDYTN